MTRRAETTKTLTEADAPAEALAEIIAGGANALTTIEQTANAAGLPKKTVEALMKRVRAQLAPVVQEVKNVTTGHIVQQLEQKAAMALRYLDDLALSSASAKDLAIVIGILLEKRQLLRGEPTHIISMEERKSVDELAQMMLKEASRRGMFIDMTAEEVRVLEPDGSRQARPRSGHKTLKEAMMQKAIERKDEIGEPR